MVLQRVLQIRNLTAQAKVTPPVATTTSTTSNATTILLLLLLLDEKTKGTSNIPNILKISEGMNMQDTCIVFCRLKKTIHSCATRHQQTYAQLCFQFILNHYEIGKQDITIIVWSTERPQLSNTVNDWSP